MLGSSIDVKINELTESNRQLKRKIFDLYTIFEISRNFNSVLNYQTLVDSFLLTSLGQVGAATAALYLPPMPDDDFLGLAKSKGFSTTRYTDQRISMTGRLARHLVSMGKPASIDELIPLFGGDPEFESFKPTPAGLLVPLIIKSSLRGILALGGKVSGHSFPTDDLEFLSILANQFAVALENARLYESEKMALEELKNTQKQLVLSERHAAIGDLSARIAHEVNNPLSIISNYLHLCERSLGDPEVLNEHLGIVREELARIARIVRQLLDFHKPRAVEKGPVNLEQIVSDVLSLVRWQFTKKNISVDVTVQEPIRMINASADQIKQVILNLIINARDFAPENGRVRIELHADEKQVFLSVSDNGPGIDIEVLPRVFEPFFTTKDGSAGTGLGLSVCYSIIHEHGGVIEAGNHSDGGARFDIRLPIAADNGRKQ